MQYSKKTLLFAFTSMLLWSKANAQCKVDECVSKLNSGFTFLKSYHSENPDDKGEYSYVFSKETNYMMALCGKDGEPGNFVVTVYDSQNKQVATNFDSKNDKYYGAILYNCKSTGIYYIKFSFKGTRDCYTGVLAIKK